MKTYDKIDTLFGRDENFVVDTNKLKQPVLATINRWATEEKIDGTNIRIMMDSEGNITFGGRTDNAQIPGDLVAHLVKTFSKENMLSAFSSEGHTIPSVVLFGEGYGGSIQKMTEKYGAAKRFRLFDVLVNEEHWLNQENKSDVAHKLSIETAPFLGYWSFDEIVDRVRVGVPSEVARIENNKEAIAEGIVARPIETLFDSRGKRIIIKLKTIDFTRQR